MKKKYIEVLVEKNAHGDELPVQIFWTKKQSYKVDSVLHVCEAADNEFDGKRYTVRIGNNERDIYRDSIGWYVEAGKARKCG